MERMKRLTGTSNPMPEALVVKLNASIEEAVTELVQLVPAQSKPLIGGIIGRMTARVLADYRDHIALHGS